MSDLLLDDRKKERTRTLVFDIEMPWLLHGLFRSPCYQHHVRYRVDIDVALLTEDGAYAVAKVVPTDGVVDRDFEDYFGGPGRPQDKSAATFRSDLHDVESVKPAVIEAAADAARRRAETVG